jgi:hypothetical protein
MNLIPKTPTFKNPPQQFNGDVWLDVIATPQNDDQRMVVSTVRFAPALVPPGTPTPTGKPST